VALDGALVRLGGYHWNGELRPWDNEILMGWYASNEGATRGKATLYFVLQDGRQFGFA
jgi:hypothetical protein